MKRAIIAAALIGVAVSPLLAGGRHTVTGAYVEARTAEVFTGGCIMNSEAETVGKQAVLAWKVDRGSFNGITIDGLSVVAAISGDRNLGMTEMGGEKPTVRTAMFVDQRANAAQQIALVAMANELSKGLVGTIVQVTPTAITFRSETDGAHRDVRRPARQRGAADRARGDGQRAVEGARRHDRSSDPDGDHVQIGNRRCAPRCSSTSAPTRRSRSRSWRWPTSCRRGSSARSFK